MKKDLKKKPNMVTFDNLEPGEVIYMYGDPSKRFVVDTLLSATVVMHEKGHDPFVSRTCLTKEEFEGRWMREIRGYARACIVADDDPIPKMNEQEFGRVLLSRLKQVATMCIGEHAIKNMDLRALRDDMTDSIIFSLRTNIATEQLSEREKTVTFKYPSSWWQQFKMQKFPAWLLKKYPVQYKKTSQKIRFEEIALYPMLPAIMPDNSGEVYFQGLFHQDYRETEKMKEDFVTVSMS